MEREESVTQRREQRRGREQKRITERRDKLTVFSGQVLFRGLN